MPLQLKINNFYFGELHMFLDNITIMPIHSNDKELFRKCREIWNKINDLIGINDPRDFVEATFDDGEDEFIMLEINIEIILYLFYIILLMISLKHR